MTLLFCFREKYILLYEKNKNIGGMIMNTSLAIMLFVVLVFVHVLMDLEDRKN